jgi:hypothetical protein
MVGCQTRSCAGRARRQGALAARSVSQFSILKPGLVGTFHHFGPQNVQRYCTEFRFRWNTREANGFKDTDRVNLALKGIAGKCLTDCRIGRQ